MENFREKLKIQNLIIGICCCILAVFGFLFAACEFGWIPNFGPVAGDSHWQSIWRGFITGVSLGLLLLLLISLPRNIRALRSDKALKKLYIKEHDERFIQVWTSARAAAMQTFLLLGLVGAIVAGYFSVVVSLTILACVLSSSLISLGFKIYYNKKY